MEYQGRWYALRAIRLGAYASAMKARSLRWGTVDLPRADFERLSQPFAERWVGSPSARTGRAADLHAAPA
ncbi:hypothetical protein BH11PLA1_BH11PLA1_15460 [soil metagenome]